MYLVPCCSTKVNLDFEIISLFFRPELFRFESLLQNDNRTNLDHAFNMANEEFSVPKLLDPAGETVFLPFTFLFFYWVASSSTITFGREDEFTQVY